MTLLKFSYLIPVALVLSVLLIGYNIEPAFADLEVTLVTPTGGNLTVNSDCSAISAGNGIIWHQCNSVLYAISSTTNAVLANISNTNANQRMLASISGTSVYSLDTSNNDLRKYTYSGGVITLTGAYEPTSCDINYMQYDVLGYIWMDCSATDQIIRFNPSTFTVVMTSQDLTDGAGIECDQPNIVAYDTQHEIGAIRCVTTNNVVTFSIASPTSITLLDSDVGSIGNAELFFHGTWSRLIAVSGADIQSWSYTSGGITSLVQTLTEVTDDCRLEPLLSNDLFMACYDDVSATTEIILYFSNQTSVYPISNSIVNMDNAMRYGYNVQTQTYLLASTINDQRYVKISGIRTIGTAPDPIGGGGSTTTGLDCSLPENENILTCRLGGDGTLEGAGAFVIGDNNNGLTGIACGIGFVDCLENPDIKTNGIGYLIFIAGILVMFGLFWMVTRGHIVEVPTFLWIISILSMAGAFALFNIIDPVIFIITIVAVIALAVPKIISTVRGDTNTLGAGNTS